jgi:hypothetical protein
MTTETDNPAYWLGRAEAVREIAEQGLDQVTRDILEEIARRYERVADHMQRGSSEPEIN